MRLLSYQLLTFVLVFFLFAETSYADVKNGLLITGISFGDELYSNGDIEYSIGVVDVTVKEGERGALDKASAASSAIVTVTFSKDNKKITLKPTHDGEGIYKGVVRFQEAGNWQVSVTVNGNYEDQSNVESQPDQGVFETPIEVKEPRSGNVVLFSLSLLFILLLAAFTLWLLIRKARKKSLLKK